MARAELAEGVRRAIAAVGQVQAVPGDGQDQIATGQFEISDERSPTEIASFLRQHGFDPVWKDWDQALAQK